MTTKDIEQEIEKYAEIYAHNRYQYGNSNIKRSVEAAFIAGANYALAQERANNTILHVHNSDCGIHDELVISPTQQPDRWISVKDSLPELDEKSGFSNNVLTWCNSELHLMNYGLIKGEDGGFVWCKVYDCADMNGDGEFDDNYTPTHWQPLPSPPIQSEKG